MSPANAKDVQAAVEAYDRCWVEGRPEDLRQYLHANVVFAGPHFERLASGVDACVQSYHQFLSQARIHGFAGSDYVIDLAGDCAVVTYRWTIDYEFAGARHKDTGQDLLVWLHRAGRWLITWRSQRPDTPASA
jgi:ketosteroid isomerase-like protein